MSHSLNFFGRPRDDPDLQLSIGSDIDSRPLGTLAVSAKGKTVKTQEKVGKILRSKASTSMEGTEELFVGSYQQHEPADELSLSNRMVSRDG
ncbi:hypothetical protein EAF00_001884 [Botryotinia globosa]|nr:hypothetical protein EAF00_001884 [Botryotinia globosa]